MQILQFRYDVHTVQLNVSKDIQSNICEQLQLKYKYVTSTYLDYNSWDLQMSKSEPSAYQPRTIRVTSVHHPRTICEPKTSQTTHLGALRTDGMRLVRPMSCDLNLQ